MEQFLDCIRTGSQPCVNGHDGRWAVAGVLAANRSFLEERSVEVTEVFDGAAVRGVSR
jgi:hypothetical protein